LNVLLRGAHNTEILNKS